MIVQQAIKPLAFGSLCEVGHHNSYLGDDRNTAKWHVFALVRLTGRLDGQHTELAGICSVQTCTSHVDDTCVATYVSGEDSLENSLYLPPAYRPVQLSSGLSTSSTQVMAS